MTQRLPNAARSTHRCRCGGVIIVYEAASCTMHSVPLCAPYQAFLAERGAKCEGAYLVNSDPAADRDPLDVPVPLGQDVSRYMPS